MVQGNTQHKCVHLQRKEGRVTMIVANLRPLRKKIMMHNLIPVFALKALISLTLIEQGQVLDKCSYILYRVGFKDWPPYSAGESAFFEVYHTL